MRVHTDNDLEQGEYSSVGGSANLYSYYGNQYGDSLEIWESIYLKIQLYHSWAYTQRHSILLPQHLLNHAHSGFIHNSQKLETT